MFTEALAFSRVTYFFYFLASQLDFFLNLQSEISYPTPFSETVQRDDTNFGPFLFYSVAKWRLKYGKRQPVAMEENTEETAAFIHCYGTCLSQTIWCTWI